MRHAAGRLGESFRADRTGSSPTGPAVLGEAIDLLRKIGSRDC